MDYFAPGMLIVKLGPELPIFPVAIRAAAPIKITKTTPTRTPKIPLAESPPSAIELSPCGFQRGSNDMEQRWFPLSRCPNMKNRSEEIGNFFGNLDGCD
ncbi:MAG: hypothetical protein Q8L13_05760 [Bradyrhizobium sp.]|nr:hypothetical protein [Bradyrhizobium sp.]